MDLAICFTNFGPYHLARLRALALRMARGGRAVSFSKPEPLTRPSGTLSRRERECTPDGFD